jgi:ABC-type Fe3+ transport system permease subunit
MKNFYKHSAILQPQKYKDQLEKDAVSLRPGVSILENVTSTIRGIVEIEQAERDRNFQILVGLAGVGIGTASIAASTVSPFVEGITQQPFKKTDGTLSPKDAALSNIITSASISLGIGFLCILVTLLVIWAFKRSRIVSQAKSHRHPPNK